MVKGNPYSKIRKYVLAHAHPAKFVSEVLGVMWATYLLWVNNWIGAIVAAFAFFLLSTIFLWNEPMEHLEKTPLGRILLVYSSPLNFFLYNLSVIPYIYGLWIHNFAYILLGVSILLFPHLWTWKR